MAKQEINISRGTYSLLKKTNGKDNNSIYFGYDKKNELLRGIFLGDKEITSTIKNIELQQNNEETELYLIISYTTDDGEIDNIKTTLLHKNYIQSVITFINTTLPTITNRLDTLEKNIGNNINSKLYWINLDNISDINVFKNNNKTT